MVSCTVMLPLFANVTYGPAALRTAVIRGSVHRLNSEGSALWELSKYWVLPEA
jgi:hypothetical protein